MLRKFGILPDHLNRKLQSAHIGGQKADSRIKKQFPGQHDSHMLRLRPRTTDTQWLNPNFFAAQIQIPIPNRYLGFGYKGLVICRNND